MPRIFHHSRFCTRAPKCLKCSGGHLTSECTKSAKAPAKCANCSGPHPANFSGCPKTPSTLRQQSQKRRKTSGKSVRLRASKIPINLNLPLRKLLKDQKQLTGCQRSDNKNGPDDVSVGRYAVLTTI
ncbi:nucleic-acid-binding protein from transposon X-element [Trichonephila clavipes]|uniref:Nucleic-acid-binding protein from transposon X-element n=1 Tax=Trichonephila clavipes TaxID=2585209 RepID=A0A8X6VI17_TRICX|nr:nucleic-acid-binding protein from transposon X-element [Trichonephila clavipes]